MQYFENIFINLNTTLYPEYWSKYLLSFTDNESDSESVTNNIFFMLFRLMKGVFIVKFLRRKVTFFPQLY